MDLHPARLDIKLLEMQYACCSYFTYSIVAILFPWRAGFKLYKIHAILYMKRKECMNEIEWLLVEGYAKPNN